MTSPGDSKVDVKRTNDLKTLFATGFISGLEPRQGTLQFYVQQVNVEAVEAKPGLLKPTSEILEIVADIRMAPATFKSLMLRMEKSIQMFEAKYGTIVSEPITSETQQPPASDTDRRYA